MAGAPLSPRGEIFTRFRSLSLASSSAPPLRKAIQFANILLQDNSFDDLAPAETLYALFDAQPTALRAWEDPPRANGTGHFGTAGNGVFGVMCITDVARRLPWVKPFVHYHSWRFSFRGELPGRRSRGGGIRRGKHDESRVLKESYEATEH